MPFRTAACSRKKPVAAHQLAAVATLLAGLCLRGRFFGQAVFQLFLDLWKLFGVGLKITCMRPLKFGLEHATDPPIRITQVVVDGRIFRLELDSALKLIVRFCVFASPMLSPAAGVDDVTFVGRMEPRPS